jgi:hypothetical protein
LTKPSDEVEKAKKQFIEEKGAMLEVEHLKYLKFLKELEENE